MQIFAKVRKRINRELIAVIKEIQRNSVKERVFNAILADGTVIEPEGIIENMQGEPDRVSIGNKTHIRGRLFIFGHGGRICIGDWCYVGLRSEIWSMESIKIGNRVLISHDVNIHDGTSHSIDPVQRHEHYKHILEKGHPRVPEELPGVFSDEIVIEDDVWIGFGSTILKGVHIGARSIIAAKSIVTDDVPPDSLYRCQISPVIVPLQKW